MKVNSKEQQNEGSLINYYEKIHFDFPHLMSWKADRPF